MFSIVQDHGVCRQAAQTWPQMSVQIQETLASVVKDFGKIDVFVANAGMLCSFHLPSRHHADRSGMAISKPILEQTLEEYRKQMSVNG